MVCFSCVCQLLSHISRCSFINNGCSVSVEGGGGLCYGFKKDFVIITDASGNQ